MPEGPLTIEQLDFFGATPKRIYKKPNYRRFTGDAFQHTVQAQLAGKCGVRSTQSPELSKSDLIAAVPVRAWVGGNEITFLKHLGFRLVVKRRAREPTTFTDTSRMISI